MHAKPVSTLLVAFAMVTFFVVASTATAAQFHSTSPSGNTTLTGSQTNIHHLKTGTWDVFCSSATFTGTMVSLTAETVTITPVYGGTCHLVALFTTTATVKFNGCDFSFNASGTLDIKCPSGKHIDIESQECVVHIQAQTIAGGLQYKNNAAKTELTVVFTAANIKYEQEGPFCPAKTGTDASLNGEVSFKGTDSGKAVSIWWE